MVVEPRSFSVRREQMTTGVRILRRYKIYARSSCEYSETNSWDGTCDSLSSCCMYFRFSVTELNENTIWSCWCAWRYSEAESRLVATCWHCTQPSFHSLKGAFLKQPWRWHHLLFTWYKDKMNSGFHFQQMNVYRQRCPCIALRYVLFFQLHYMKYYADCHSQPVEHHHHPPEWC